MSKTKTVAAYFLRFVVLSQFAATAVYGATPAQCEILFPSGPVSEKPTEVAQAKVSRVENQKFVQKAIEMVQAARSLFFQAFNEKSGFKNLEDFENEFSNQHPSNKELFDVFSMEEIDVAIYRTSKRRESIVDNGFLNLHQTGTSGGGTDVPIRNDAEAGMLGLDISDYEGLPSVIKPKSALIQPGPNANIKRRQYMMYGEDAYIIDINKVRDRLTLTAGDSLNNYIAGLRETNWILDSWKKFSRIKAQNWNQFFIPWVARSLVTPFLAVEYMQKNSFDMMHPYVPKHYWARREPNHPAVSLMTARELKTSDEWHDLAYIEAQVWGPVSIEDVKAFQFFRQPPEGRFLQALIDHGIEIRDARHYAKEVNLGEPDQTSEKPKIWKPGMP